MNASSVNATRPPSLANMTTTVLSTTLSSMNSSSPSIGYNSSGNWTSANIPTSPSPVSVYDCKSFQYNFDNNIPVSAICGLCFLIGVVMIFVGYRAFRVSMFIVGLSLTSLLTYLILSDQTSLDFKWIAVIAAGAGLLCGVLAAALPVLGLVIASIVQAFFFMIITLLVVSIFTSSHLFWTCIGTVSGLSIVFTVIMFVRQRGAAIVYISSFGTILIMLAVDYYLDMFLISRYAYHLIFPSVARKPCWFSWTVFALWPFLVILGCLVQFLKTAKGFSHRPVKKQSAQNKYKTDSNGRSRRLYDNGDVIAQAWIQTSEDTLEKRRSFTPVYDYESPDDKESTTLV